MHTATPICTSLNRIDAGTARKWAVLWCIMHTMQKRKKKKKSAFLWDYTGYCVSKRGEARVSQPDCCTAWHLMSKGKPTDVFTLPKKKKKSALLTSLSGASHLPNRNTENTILTVLTRLIVYLKSVDDRCRHEGDAHYRGNEKVVKAAVYVGGRVLTVTRLSSLCSNKAMKVKKKPLG